MTDQPELPGMPEETALGKAAKNFIAVKERIAEAKLQIEDLEKEILKEMNEAEVPHFKVTAGGENYEFELMRGTESLRCAKMTKTAKKAAKSEPAAEPAMA